MLIKIADNPERFINTDSLESVTFDLRSQSCVLNFNSGRAMRVSENAARAMLEFAEANQSVLDDDMQPAGGMPFVHVTERASLTSRLAQHLRDGAPNGASVMDLVMIFDNFQESELIAALDTLLAERVIILNDSPPLAKYFHASNAPKPVGAPNVTPLDHTPDSSPQSDTLPSAS